MILNQSIIISHEKRNARAHFYNPRPRHCNPATYIIKEVLFALKATRGTPTSLGSWSCALQRAAKHRTSFLFAL